LLERSVKGPRVPLNRMVRQLTESECWLAEDDRLAGGESAGDPFEAEEGRDHAVTVAKHRSCGDDVFSERPVAAREDEQAKLRTVSQPERHLRVGLTALPELSRPPPALETGRADAAAGASSGLAEAERTPGTPLQTNCVRPRNGDLKVGHFGCELDDSGVGGLTGFATKEWDEPLSDVWPSSDMPGWNSVRKAAYRCSDVDAPIRLNLLATWSG
jgi:hypothetical protein